MYLSSPSPKGAIPFAPSMPRALSTLVSYMSFQSYLMQTREVCANILL